MKDDMFSAENPPESSGAIPRKQRIGVLGNMNNNGFAIMRYLRDLGYDAQLLLYSDDGVGGSAHFAPSCDTWEYGRWAPYIKRTRIANNIDTVVGAPSRFRWKRSVNFLKNELSGFERFIGSGIAPAIFFKMRRQLDIFYPYSNGIEMYGSMRFLTAMRRTPLHWFLASRLRKLQAAGIQNSTHCLNAEMSVTKRSFEEIGKDFLPYFIPMVYNREPLPKAVPEGLEAAVGAISKSSFTVFSHARQLWIRKPLYTQQEWEIESKNSDFLIRGFAEFLNSQVGSNSLLILVEYGDDVDASKRLCSQLGIQDSVFWVARNNRKNLLYLLRMCDVGVGQFYLDPGQMWGGTGWEVLAFGKPLLQSVNFTAQEFEARFKVPLPPCVDAKSPSQIASSLKLLREDTETRLLMGFSASSWFDQYNGIGMARRWADLLN